MGQDELVLKVPAAMKRGGGHGPVTAAGGKMGSASELDERRTHSRESSGASVKFVNCSAASSSSGSGAGLHWSPRRHRRTLSKSSGQSAHSVESHVIILSPSEDLTVSDRLSHEGEEEADRDEFPEEHNQDGETKCNCDSDERVSSPDSVDVKIRMPSGDAKSQHSDYGSFCNTPSEPFAHSRATSGATPAKSTSADERGAAAGSAAGATGDEHRRDGAANLAGPGADESDKIEKVDDDQSVMANESHQRQPLLNDTHDSNSSDEEEGATNSSGYTRRKSRHPKPTSVRIDIESEGEESTDMIDGCDDDDDNIPQEPLKTLLAFVFMFCGFVATTTSLALTHERVPDIDPLPDAFLDNVSYQPWGLDASEIIIMVATLAAFILAVFHKHRCIVLRRIFLLAGIHYYYRAISMYITVLPKADPHYKCAPKLNATSAADIVIRVFKLLSGMGLSINGQHVYCGDYIYSGHTMTLIMTFLVIKEYSPKRWFLLHWLSFLTVVTGVLTLLFSRGHYSIDVVIAYWITTRLWWMYHTLANNPGLVDGGNKHNYLSNVWWWYIFRYFEVKVGRPLPKRYNWPLPKKLLRWRPSAWRSRGAASASAAANRDAA